MKRRPVEPVAEFLNEILQDFRRPSSKCATGADLLLEELETQNPSLEDRCGLLADRYELYSLQVPDCPLLALIVSLDLASPLPWPCTIHGLLQSGARTCELGRGLATKHFKLTNPSWEPAK